MYLVINFLQKLYSIFTFSLFKQRHMQEPRSCLSNGVSCPCAGALCWIFQLIQVLVATSLHKYVSICCLSLYHGHHVTKDTLFPKILTLGNNFLANFTDNVVVSGLKLSVFDGAYHGEHGFVLFCC